MSDVRTTWTPVWVYSGLFLAFLVGFAVALDLVPAGWLCLALAGVAVVGIVVSAVCVVHAAHSAIEHEDALEEAL